MVSITGEDISHNNAGGGWEAEHCNPAAPWGPDVRERSALPWHRPEEPSEERNCRIVLLTSDDGRYVLTDDDGTNVLTAEVCDPFH